MDITMVGKKEYEVDEKIDIKPEIRKEDLDSMQLEGYNFNLSTNDNFRNTVVFESTYNNDDRYCSMFFLNPNDAIKLGERLISAGQSCLNQEIYFNHVDIKRFCLIDNIKSQNIIGIKVFLLNPYGDIGRVSISKIFESYEEEEKNTLFDFNALSFLTKVIQKSFQEIITPNERLERGYYISLYKIISIFIDTIIENIYEFLDIPEDTEFKIIFESLNIRLKRYICKKYESIVDEVFNTQVSASRMMEEKINSFLTGESEYVGKPIELQKPSNEEIEEMSREFLEELKTQEKEEEE
ncbi:MAG: hypothetical protein PHC62_00790 [Candidatus Izemoplasmatales bacterium]|nr:hypothetical protein [Candidatus Izemoplasmatales bacterium]